MKTIQMLTATGAILLALAGPSLAAQRAHRGVDAYASGAVTTDRSGAYNYGPSGARAQGRVFVQEPQFGNQYNQYDRGQNLPYPDRPYGAPDRW
jgi:hypothetical protein